MSRMMAKKDERIAKHWLNNSELMQNNPQRRMEYLRDTLEKSEKGGLFSKNSTSYASVLDCMGKVEMYFNSTPFAYTMSETEMTMNALFEYYEQLIKACDNYLDRISRTAKGKNRQLIVGFIRHYAKFDYANVQRLYNAVSGDSAVLDDGMRTQRLGDLMQLFHNKVIGEAQGASNTKAVQRK